MKKAVLVVCSTLLLSGCPPIEKTGRNLVVSADVFIERAKLNHPECNPKLTADHQLIRQFGPVADNQTCRLIDRAITYQNIAADALNYYCSGTPPPDTKSYDDGGVCVPLKSKEAKDRLKAALSDLKPWADAVQELIK